MGRDNYKEINKDKVKGRTKFLPLILYVHQKIVIIIVNRKENVLVNKFEMESLMKKKETIIDAIKFQTVLMKMDIEDLEHKIMETVIATKGNCVCQTEDNMYRLMARNIETVVEEYIEKFDNNINEIIEDVEEKFQFKESRSEKEKNKRGRPKKFNGIDFVKIAIEYEKTHSVKAVVEKYKSMGKSISDKQVRNILEEAGLYKKRVRKS